VPLDRRGARRLSRPVSGAILVAVVSLGFIGAALAVVAYEERGVATTAKVASCETRSKLPPLCRGTWMDGDLLAGGRVVFGTIDGANRDDIGGEIAVRTDGDTAWTTTNRIPYLLGGLGVAAAVFGAVAIARNARRRPPAGTLSPPGHASIGTKA